MMDFARLRLAARSQSLACRTPVVAGCSGEGRWAGRRAALWTSLGCASLRAPEDRRLLDADCRGVLGRRALERGEERPYGLRSAAPRCARRRTGACGARLRLAARSQSLACWRWRGPSRTSDGAAWHWACSGAAPSSSRERALGEARGFGSASPSRRERRSRAAVCGSRRAMKSDALGKREGRASAHRDGTSRDGSHPRVPIEGSRSVRAQRYAGGERLDSRLRRSPACFDGSSRVGKDFPRLHPHRRPQPRTSASGDALTGRRKRDLVLLRPTPKYNQTIRPLPDRYKQILDSAPSRTPQTRLAPRQ